MVTSFEFRLHSLGPTVLAGPILWDPRDAGEVLRFYRDFVREAPNELGTVVRFGTAPPLPVIPEARRAPMVSGGHMVRFERCFEVELADVTEPLPVYVRWPVPA